MELNVVIAGASYAVDLDRPLSLAIALDFAGPHDISNTAVRYLAGLRIENGQRVPLPEVTEEHLALAKQNLKTHFSVVGTVERFSALVRDSSELDEMLHERGIDTVLVTGTLTNVCCESTARDAMQMGYKTVMVSDANATRTDAEHTATLVTFIQSFGDVRPTEEVVALLEASPARLEAAE